jgi:hypothetical protein
MMESLSNFTKMRRLSWAGGKGSRWHGARESCHSPTPSSKRKPAQLVIKA